MLRDDRLAWLNDLEVHLLEALERYVLAEHYFEGADWQRFCRERIEHYRHEATVVQEIVRALGDLPDVPDADREAVAEVSVRLRGLAPDHEIALRERLAEEERRVRQLAQEGLAFTLPDGSSDVLERIRDDAAQAESRLHH